VGPKGKARQLVLTSLFEFEPGCDSGVTGFGGLPEVYSQTPVLPVFLKPRFSNWTCNVAEVVLAAGSHQSSDY